MSLCTVFNDPAAQVKSDEDAAPKTTGIATIEKPSADVPATHVMNRWTCS